MALPASRSSNSFANTNDRRCADVLCCYGLGINGFVVFFVICAAFGMTDDNMIAAKFTDHLSRNVTSMCARCVSYGNLVRQWQHYPSINLFKVLIKVYGGQINTSHFAPFLVTSSFRRVISAAEALRPFIFQLPATSALGCGHAG